MRSFCLALVLASCVNARHAEIQLANNPLGADCFARCVSTTSRGDAVDCVARCPGAVQAKGTCGDGLACVEDRLMAKGKTTWLVIGAVVSTLILAVLVFPPSGGGV